MIFYEVIMVSSTTPFLHYNPSFTSQVKFGGSKEEYLSLTRTMLSEEVEQLRKDQSNPEIDAEEIFFSLLSRLEKFRKNLAIQFQTPQAEDFGLQRTEPGTPSFSYTLLDGEYRHLGKKVLNWLADQLYCFKKKAVRSATLDPQTVVYFKVINPPHFSVIGPIVQRLPLLPETPHPSPEEKEKFCKAEQTFREKLRHLKEHHASDYTLLNDFLNTGYLTYSFNLSHFHKIRFFSAQVFHIFCDQQFLTAEYIAPFDASLSTSKAVSSMKAHSTVLIHHMDKSDLSFCLSEIAFIFERILIGKNEQAISDLAEFQHKWSFISPYVRGNGAIGEWLEIILTSYKGYLERLPRHTTVNLEALTTPSLWEFIDGYRALIHLQPKTPLTKSLDNKAPQQTKDSSPCDCRALC